MFITVDSLNVILPSFVDWFKMDIKDKEMNSLGKKKRLILGITVPIFLLGLVSLFTDISSEMIQSILPFFIVEIGGSAIILGLITGTTNALSNILKGVSGWLSDKYNRRKPFIIAGYTLSNLSKPFIGFSQSWGSVLGLKALDRVGKGLRTSPRDALISFHAIKRGKEFGFHRAMDTLGAVIGSLVALLLLFFGSTYSQIIFLSIIPGVIALFILIPVKEVTLEESKIKFGEKVIDPKSDKISKNFIKLIIILGVIEFASLDVAFLIYRAADYIPSELIFLIPAFYLILNLVYTLFSPISGALSDKIGRKPVIVIGLSVLLTTCIILAFPIQISTFSLILIIIIFILHGFYLASVDPISRAYIADLVGKDKRGRAYGYYYLSVGFISMAEAFIFGLIYEISFTWAFIYISILLLVCIIIFILTDFSKITEKK